MLLDEECFSIGRIKVLPQQDTLICGDKTITIQSMTTRLLCYMAEQPDKVISREDLKTHIWNNTSTTAHTISQHIYLLRQALNSLDPDSQYILTVTGKQASGYRMLAQLTLAGQGEKPAKKRPGLSSRAGKFIGQSSLFTRNILISGILLLTCSLVFIYSIYPITWTHSLLPQQVTFIEGRERNAAVSPDGSLIAYSHKDPNSPFWTIRLQQLEGEQQVVSLTPNPAIAMSTADKAVAKLGHHVYEDFPVFTPDGKGVSFLRFHRGNKAFYHIEINPDKLTFGPETKLLDIDEFDDMARIAWIDQDNFVYSSHMGEDTTPYKLYKYNTRTRKTIQLTSPPLYGRGDYLFDVSPDGKNIAIIRKKVGGYFLYFYDLTLDKLTEIANIGQRQRNNITWLDNKAVLYLNDLGYLTRYRLDTEQFEPYSESKDIGYYPVKARNNRAIVMQQEWSYLSNGASIVSAINPRTQPGKNQAKAPGFFTELIPPTGHHRLATWAGDERVVYSRLNPNKSQEIRLLSKQENRLLLYFDQEVTWPPQISVRPDSNEALINADNSCFLIDIATQQVSQLCPDGINPKYASWSKDGQWLYFSLSKNDQWPLMRMGRMGFPIERFGPENVAIAKEGWDGKLYFRPKKSIDIYQYDPETDSSSLLIDRQLMLGFFTNNDFQVTREGIYYSDRVDEESNLYFYEFASQSRQFVMARPSNYENFSINDDETTIYFSRPGDSESHLFRIQ
ncbi:winged helix-turn-helix domain-containing protein [Thalassomonas actiniarum]|uniref:PD40 domain-containing protein n=1 Tax=Thalassomonas actiniarum TaxID=485447 RepID=A0AAE9YX78_9GAMM|nr:winged helix-turn-helix domain-containing protein [Thalassomonas actiniarum]WDE02553.1 PD40 domain-containing protein [Thalassomonas actiniarum]